MTEAEIKTAAMKCARGVYQRALITGQQNWSGASLAWCAKNGWGHRYARSRRRLYERLRRADIAYLTKHYKTGKLTLVFGRSPGTLPTQCAVGACWIVGGAK